MSMRSLALLTLVLSIACARATNGQGRSSAASKDSVKATLPSLDSVLAIFDAYWDRRVTAAAAPKVIAEYLVSTHEPLNVQMDDSLRAAVALALKKRRGP